MIIDNNGGCESGNPVKAKPQNIDEGSTAGLVFASEAYNPDALKSLLAFCVNNKDLDKLESMINKFNPLKVLRIEGAEIRNSNVLSWLIDPMGHHGIGEILFKNILLEVLKCGCVDGLPQIKDVLGESYSDLHIFREYKNIDLLAVSHSAKLVVVFENKLYASESEQQLTKYVNIIDKKYPEYKRVFIFLTLDGIKPRGSDRYIVFTHEQIHSIIQSTVEIRKNYMNAKVYDFIQQFLEVIEEKTTMKNTELVEICGKLYREHGAAIRMIMEYGKPKLPPSSIKEFHNRTNTQSVHEDKDYVPVYYSLIPKSWSSLVPITNKDRSDKYLVFVYLNFADYEKHKISISIRIGNFPDSKERESFIKAVCEAADADKSSQLTVRRASKSYTTVYSQTIDLKHSGGDECELDEYDTITDKMVKAYNSSGMCQALMVIDGVVQKFQFGDVGRV